MAAATVSRDDLARAIRKDVREEFGWAEAHDWVFHDRADSYTPAELARLRTLQEQWKALSDQGEAEGWLDRTGGYPGNVLEPAELVNHPTRTTRVRETKANRTSRIQEVTADVDREVEARVEAQWKSLQDAEAVIARLGR